ncbi:glycosyltransferase [Paradevosia shaoguanensis]|uniref:glycosyltransferase n=1 Tax=Paradevosia shaoguanensis TaxID=1335043 RepID=UPI003C7492B3
MTAKNIVIIAHYFPPINSSGAKRMEAMSKYFAKAGRNVTVISTTKLAGQGEFSEPFPDGVEVIELNWWGKVSPTPLSEVASETASQVHPRSAWRRFKDLVMGMFGQLPDPRLPFALSFLRSRLSEPVSKALRNADVVLATTPPWPPLLAAVIAKRRFGSRIILDYRDQFSMCHEMPGGRFAKGIEIVVDRFLAKRGDALVAISPPMTDYYRPFNANCATILNGYDQERLDQAKAINCWSPRRAGDPLVIRYLGLVSEGRIPQAMLAALSKKAADGTISPLSLQFEYYGEVGLMREHIDANHPELAPFFKFLPRVSYGRSLELAVTADYLLFAENSIPPKPGEMQSAQGILTTKLFEYLGSGRPIVAHVAPETLAGSFIAKAAGNVVSVDERDFCELFSSKQFWTPGPGKVAPFVPSLSRASQADQYLRLLDDVVAGKPVTDNWALD